MNQQASYKPFLSSRCGPAWKRLGAHRRAIAATPLFSIHSKRSAGVGEFRDLALLADWCVRTGISVIQLLPMNDTGMTFRPYDAESSIALEPMYLSLDEVPGMEQKPFRSRAAQLHRDFPAGLPFNRLIKRAKMDLLWDLFTALPPDRAAGFRRFLAAEKAWLRPYTVFKVLKEKFHGAGWESWPAPYRDEVPGELDPGDERRALFHAWTQWLSNEQFSAAAKACREKGVFLMGDLPFLVSRDSADAWADRCFFKLHLAAGAPPDACFAGGQKWGMPPYDWERIAADDYRYLARRLRYAERFYDLFRIDHFVGIFRIWCFPVEGGAGFFDPQDERGWENHGRHILDAVLAATKMLPCAEDLGTVPACSFKLLKEYCIPGMEIQRWVTTGPDAFEFKAPSEYRPNAVATVSTHDLSPLAAWWTFEAGTVDEGTIRGKCADRGLDPNRALERLFDMARSSRGRLRWRRDVADAGALPGLLERRHEEVGDFIALHRETFDERRRFWEYLGLDGPPAESADPVFIAAALRKAAEAASVFAGHLLQDWLSVSTALRGTDPWEFRINFPGTVDERNWTLVLPLSLEAMLKLKENQFLLEMNRRAGRVPESRVRS